MGMFAWAIEENKAKGDDSMMKSDVRNHRLANLMHVFQNHGNGTKIVLLTLDT